MKVTWLNDSLAFRAENKKEKMALAVLHDALKPEPESDTISEAESSDRAQLVE
jgi:hypothetical protein